MTQHPALCIWRLAIAAVFLALLGAPRLGIADAFAQVSALPVDRAAALDHEMERLERDARAAACATGYAARSGTRGDGPHATSRPDQVTVRMP